MLGGSEGVDALCWREELVDGVAEDAEAVLGQDGLRVELEGHEVLAPNPDHLLEGGGPAQGPRWVTNQGLRPGGGDLADKKTAGWAINLAGRQRGVRFL